MSAKKILVAFGTRPEAIKLAPVIKELRRYPKRFKVVVLVTAQHRQMLDTVLELFALEPDYDLGIMMTNQSLGDVVVRILQRIEPVLKKERPDLVLVQGDATSAFACALAAYYQKIPIGHIEAGLRTQDKYQPFPEEVNRRFITALADLHFAPTGWARMNLIEEGVDRRRIFVTGNTVIDALKEIVRRQGPGRVPVLNTINPNNRLLLVTIHRRENFGRPLTGICQALRQIVRLHPDVEIVFPVHLNPMVRGTVRTILSNHKRIHLIPPLDYLNFIQVLKSSYLVLTDSGGIQEEAPVLGKPVLVLRNRTERPEAIEAGTAKLLGTEPARIIRETSILLKSKRCYQKMARAKSPFGDGRAAKRIREILTRFLAC
ncbi:MAG: UDP-N-acetylglucosamine 2-epimerase (non-hydrolyzing) [candidate division WOR-3 bacterium]